MVRACCIWVLAVSAASAADWQILEFTASWCGPCRTMAPAMERLQAAGYPLRVIDVDREPQIAQQHRVTHLPTVILLRDGQEVARRVGARSYVELVRWFQKAGLQPGALRSRSASVRGQSPDEDRSRMAPASAHTRPLANPPASPTSPRRGISGNPDGSPLRQTGASIPAAARRAGASAIERALGATVRLRVEDANGFSFGTGTIIDVSGGHALVVTCGHIFRDSQGRGKIQVDLFGPHAGRSVEGRLLTYEADQRDIGFVVIQPGVPIEPVPVAGRNQPLQVGLPVFSVGCNRGADPTVEQTQITAVNRYAHGPNLEIDGQPVDGRSGGGLFTTQGELIGVCNAADPQERKGLYASLPLIHEYLGKLGLTRLIRDTNSSLASTETSPSGHAAPQPEPPVVPVARSGLTPAVTSTTGSSSTQGARGSGELICVVRDPATGRERVIVVRQPTRHLIAQLEAAAANGHAPAPPAPNSRATSGSTPVVRGQSFE